MVSGAGRQRRRPRWAGLILPPGRLNAAENWPLRTRHPGPSAGSNPKSLRFVRPLTVSSGWRSTQPICRDRRPGHARHRFPTVEEL